MIFTTQKAAREKIEGLESRILELESEIQSFEAIKQSIVEKDQSISDLTNQVETLTSELSAKTEESATLAAELEAAKAAAPQIAVEMLAGAGIENPLPVESSGETSRTPHLDKFNSLKGSEATAYFKANRKAIAAEQKIS